MRRSSSIVMSEEKREAARQRAHDWYHNNKERARDTRRKYLEKNRESLKEARREWINENKEYWKNYQKDWRDKNHEKVKSQALARYYKHREKTKDKRLKKLYGISQTQRDEIEARQEGNCAICLRRPGTHTLYVDHCHRTGIVRGLLCHNCNSLIGRAKDSIQILQSAIEYLGGEL